MTYASDYPELQRAAELCAMAGIRDLPSAHFPYVIDASEAPQLIADIEGGYAATARWMPEAIKMHLHERDRWFGYSFACVLWLSRVYDKLPSLRHDRGEQDRIIGGLALHELAHHLADEATRQTVGAGPRDALFEHDSDARGMHGAKFVRACCHVGYRAFRHGWQGGVDALVFAGEFYDLSDHSEYWSTLFNEVERCDRDSIVSILQSPPPKTFVDLFYEDTQEVLR